MKPQVEDHLAKVKELWRAAVQVCAVESLPACPIRKLVDSFGALSFTMRTLHAEVANGRCVLEDMVKKQREEVLQRTTTIVGTLDALTKSQSLKHFAEGHANRTIRLIAIDEITEILLLQYHMFCGS